MKLKSLRPSYALRRMAQERFYKKHPETPWLTRSGILLLESWLKPTDRVIEWGSGRSTVWFANRVGRILSIEGYKPWYDKVVVMLGEKKLAEKVDYRYVPLELGDFEEPEQHAYVDAAESYEDGSVDFALVDGGIRARCMEVAMRKLKPGGLLGLDNANRWVPNTSLGSHSTVHEPRDEYWSKKWAEIGERLSPWRAILTSDGIWDTRFWVKPI